MMITGQNGTAVDVDDTDHAIMIMVVMVTTHDHGSHGNKDTHGDQDKSSTTDRHFQLLAY